MDLISKETSEGLDELVGGFFDLNRTTDRMISWMTNVWCMPQAVSIIHPDIAHLYPLLADLVTEIKDRYNMTSVYPETHRDAREYRDLKDMFETLYQENADMYTMIKMVNKIANEKGDFNVHADLVGLMQKFSKLMEQIYTLKDKSEQMPTDYAKFDRQISSWGISGLDLED